MENFCLFAFKFQLLISQFHSTALSVFCLNLERIYFNFNDLPILETGQELVPFYHYVTLGTDTLQCTSYPGFPSHHYNKTNLGLVYATDALQSLYLAFSLYTDYLFFVKVHALYYMYIAAFWNSHSYGDDCKISIFS